MSLSEQELVDCDTKGHNKGCNGGHMEDAFKYIVKNGGITSEAKYPYKEIDGTCNSEKEASAVVQIKGYEMVPANSEAALLKAVANQPVSVAIDGGGSDFQFYSSGVFTGHCRTRLNHAVAAIGYGTNKDGTKYWLLKNSWSTTWGDKGYMKMKRDIDSEKGLCGIAKKASYPIA